MRRRERVGFSAAGFGQNLVLNVVTLFLLVYLVEGVGLPTAGIAKATAILGAAKVWDAITDILLGLVVDRTRTRWGRFRPYILLTAAPIALLTIALFHLPPGSEDARLVWFGVLYVLWSMAYTLCDVPYWAMTNVVTSDDADRTRLIAWARTAGVLALAVVTLAGVPLARALSFGPTTTEAGWGRLAIAASVVGMGLFTLAFFTTTERVEAAAPPPLREGLALITRNPGLLWLLASGVLGFGRFVLQVGGVVLALVVFGDEGFFTLLGAALIASMVVATLATPALLRRMTRKALMIGSSAVAAVVYLVQWFVGYTSLPAVIACVAATGLLLGIFMVTQTTMIGDAADDGERRTGQRMAGIAFAGLTFVGKLSGAVATIVFGLAVAAIGYTKGVPVTPAMRDGLWAAVTLVPAASVALSILPLLAYRVPESPTGA